MAVKTFNTGFGKPKSLATLEFKLRSLKQGFDKKSSTEFYTSEAVSTALGIHNIRGSKFSIRDERTASASALNNLAIYDFGLGVTHFETIMVETLNFQLEERLKKELGRIPTSIELHQHLDFLVYEFDTKNFPQKEKAIKKILSFFFFLIGEKEDTFEFSKISLQRETIQEVSMPIVQPMERDTWYFSSKADEEFTPMLSSIMRVSPPEDVAYAHNLYRLGIKPGDYKECVMEGGKESWKKIKRIMIPHKMLNGNVFEYHGANRISVPKVKARRTNKEEKKDFYTPLTLLGEHLIPTFSQKTPILFPEGHSDGLTFAGMKFQTLTSGGAAKEIPLRALKALEGHTIHFLPDNDDAGYAGIIKKVMQVELYNLTKKKKSEMISYKVRTWGFNFTKPTLGHKSDISVNLLEDLNVYASEIVNKELSKANSPLNVDRKPLNNQIFEAKKILGKNLNKILLSKVTSQWSISTKDVAVKYDTIDYFQDALVAGTYQTVRKTLEKVYLPKA